MDSRVIWTPAVALTLFALLGCPSAQAPKPVSNKQSEPAPPDKPKRPDGLVGFYVQDDPAAYGAKDMKSVPPGRVMYLGIEKGRWMMRDMMTAYGGTWTEVKGDAILTVTEGPTGKANGKETITVKRTENGITLAPNGSPAPAMRFAYVGMVAPKEFGYDEFLNPKK